MKRNLKISKTSKQRSLTFNEYQPAGREEAGGARLPYNRDGNARRKIRIEALKETVLQQSMVVFGFFI